MSNQPIQVHESGWEIVTAVGAILAVGVSVYVGVLRDRFRRPKLSLSFAPLKTDSSSTDEIVVEDPTGTVEAAYVRLKVVTAKRRRAAEGVEVMVLSARGLVARPGHAPILGFSTIPIDGMLLRWSNTDPTQSITRLVIPSGIYRHVDLLRVDRAPSGIGTETQIEVRPEPGNRRHVVDAFAKFELQLAVTAANADARRYRLEIEFDGEWAPNDKFDVWDHLSVSSPDTIE